MTQTELRNTLVRLLYDALGGPLVVLSDQVMPEADYPYIYYQSIQQHIPGPYNIGYASGEKYRSEQAGATYSFTACSANRMGKDGVAIKGDDEALALADLAQGFFLFAGRQLLASYGIVVVSVENTQSRSAMTGDETDRRYGFDVRVRYERLDTRTVPHLEPPIITVKED